MVLARKVVSQHNNLAHCISANSAVKFNSPPMKGNPIWATPIYYIRCNLRLLNVWKLHAVALLLILALKQHADKECDNAE